VTVEVLAQSGSNNPRQTTVGLDAKPFGLEAISGGNSDGQTFGFAFSDLSTWHSRLSICSITTHRTLSV
jgi:hypothetical protein